MNLSPIVLFVYNRPEHTRLTIEALKANLLAEESLLYIYSDAARNESSISSVEEVRKYVKDVNGFKKVIVTERSENYGLARSIVEGVSHLVNEYGKIIVLEDDIVTSPYFLKFMNEALDYYKDNNKVWHVSGWNYPIDDQGLDDVFLWRFMNCWGWGTWANRWMHFEKDAKKTIRSFSRSDIKYFNIDGSYNFFEQVKLNYSLKINTWAIFWYVTIFSNKGLCLNPSKTLTMNIGRDGSGVHCVDIEELPNEISEQDHFNFINANEENELAVNRIKEYFKSFHVPLYKRVLNKIFRIFNG